MTEHKDAVLLRAIADGLALEWKIIHVDKPTWIDASESFALERIALGVGANLRVKPVPKSIVFMNAYSNGKVGGVHHSRQEADNHISIAYGARTAVIETLDNGDIVIHKDVQT